LGRLKSKVYGQLLAWATKCVSMGLVRIHVAGEELVLEYLSQGRPVIFAGWHGHNFLTMCGYYAVMSKHFKGATIMVPESSNGLVLDYFGQQVGIHVIKVSSELGPSQWARATVSMIKRLRDGYCAMLSPDGPTGPAYQVKPGIAVIAMQSKGVIIPASTAGSRCFKLRSRWDAHLIPLPFSRAIVHLGTPIDTTDGEGPVLSTEQLQARIQAALEEGALTAAQLIRGISSGSAGKGMYYEN
jgi:lysophospholipid acyltransferase (LPLAT)-like uncharacterized protein